MLAFAVRFGFLVILLIHMFRPLSAGQEKEKRFEIKQEMISVLRVFDSECPLQLLEPSTVFCFGNGAISVDYALQNISETNVDNFEIQQINWFNTHGNTITGEVRHDKWVFAPLTTYSSLADSEPFDLVDLDKKTADKLGFSRLSNRILILMVVKVKLADGKTYDASRQFKALERFLTDLGDSDDTSKVEVERQKERIRSFISAMFANAIQDKS